MQRLQDDQTQLNLAMKAEFLFIPQDPYPVSVAEEEHLMMGETPQRLDRFIHHRLAILSVTLSTGKKMLSSHNDCHREKCAGNEDEVEPSMVEVESHVPKHLGDEDPVLRR